MIQLEVTEKERKLIEYLRKIPYGEVTIFLHDSEPVKIEIAKEKIQL